MINKLGVIFLWIAIVTTMLLFLLSKNHANQQIAITWLFASQFLSLIGVTLLAASFILSGRFRFIEVLFGGLDKMYKIHHITGGVAFVLLLHHPIFLAVNALPNISLGWKYLWFSNILSYNFGVAGIYLMLLLLVLTFITNLPYHIWLKTHEYMGLALLLSSVHILTINSDVSRYLPLRYWIIALLILSSFSVIYRLFLRKIFKTSYKYSVSAIQRIGDVVEITMKPVDKKMSYSAGQFIFATFKSLGNEPHPFSIASHSNSEEIVLGIKILGDYTLNVKDVVAGEEVLIEGPFGMFNEPTIGEKDLIWIAGGIGITPFLGMLEDQKNRTDRKIDLFYCVKTQDDAIFEQKILAKIANSTNINYWKFCSADKGRISAEVLASSVPDIKNRKIMLCGPTVMMESLTKQLMKIGIKKRNIIFEDFNFK